jgi:hypothetical protein
MPTPASRGAQPLTDGALDIPDDDEETQDEDVFSDETGLDLDVDESPISRYRRLRQHERELEARIAGASQTLEQLHGWLDATREAKRRAVAAIEATIDDSIEVDDDGKAVKQVLQRIQEARPW